MGVRLKIAVFSSGNGGNFEYLVKHSFQNGFEVVKLVTDKKCGAEHKATAYGVDTFRIPKKNDLLDFSAILNDFSNEAWDLIVLAGFMPIVPADFLSSWGRVIINTHPSLLPKHGGFGMFGVKVQESVLNSKDEFAGCTVHHVTSDVDMGEIIYQQKFKVPENISAWDLGGIVFQLEGPQLVRAIKLLGG